MDMEEKKLTADAAEQALPVQELPADIPAEVRQKLAEKCKDLEKDEQELLSGGVLTAALIERLIERITVYPDKQVDVKFTFRAEFEAFKEAEAE